MSLLLSTVTGLIAALEIHQICTNNRGMFLDALCAREAHGFTCLVLLWCLSGLSLNVTTSERPFLNFYLQESSCPKPCALITSFLDSVLFMEDAAVNRTRPVLEHCDSTDKVKGLELILVEDSFSLWLTHPHIHIHTNVQMQLMVPHRKHISCHGNV